MRKVIIIVTICCISLGLLAHEFWLMPNHFFVDVKQFIKISFNVGEEYKGENWKGNRTRIQTLTHYLPSQKSIDVQKQLSLQSGDSLQLFVKDSGTHMVTYNSKNSFIQLTPKKFEDYLKEDGLSNTLAFREANNQQNIDGKEYYQRSVKTIFQCGTTLTFNGLQQTNLPLDIVPLSHVYVSKKETKDIEFVIYFNKKPLQNQLVKVWHRTKTTSLKEILTDNLGKIKATISNNGKWMISTVYMEQNKKDTIAQWQSYWGSLTFGY